MLTEQRFRILSLDGGGIKGVFTAAVLARWEQATGRRIRDHFDLIAGTSTGGIIAIGLGLGLSAVEILDFYRRYGPSIFPTTAGFRKLGLSLGHLVQPKYSQCILSDSLSSVFDGKRIGHSYCRLLIPTYDVVNGRIYLLKTAHNRQFDRDFRISAVDAALATAAAPSFFDLSAIPELQGMQCVDGGVWANCPSLAAVIEGFRFLEVPLEKMDVLSVGSTRELPHLLCRINKGIFGVFKPGVLRWMPHLLGLLFESQIELSNSAASLLVGKEHYLRVNRTVPERWFSLDSAERINDMVVVGDALASEAQTLSDVKRRFLNGHNTEPFDPIYRPE